MPLFVIILMKKMKKKVYGEREIEREMDLSNFMYARLDGCFKRNDNK